MHNGRWLVVGFTVLLTAGIFGPDVGLSEGAELDPAVVAVLPFHHLGAASPTLLSGDECEFFLTTALSRWYGVKLVDELRLNDALARRGSAPLTAGAGSEIAGEVGAGRLIAGEVWQVGDSVYVKATLRSALRPAAALKEHTIALSSDLKDVARKFSELADALLLGRDSLAPDLREASFGTNSIEAWRQYTLGHRALADWDVQGAERAFGAAAATDPDFPQASLMLAQSFLLAGDTGAALREAAARAFALRQQLSPRDRVLAEAAQAIADGRHPHACRLYRSLVVADSLDFAGWYGLGFCQLADPVVERDPRSPSGWRFRGSGHAGVESFRRAFSILPSSHLAFRGAALRRLTGIFFSDPSKIRVGFGVSPRDTQMFAARATLGSDTLRFVPVRAADLVYTRLSATPAPNVAAIERGRQTILRIAQRWVAAFPESPDALEAETTALEALEIGRSPLPAGKDALGLVRQARQLAREPRQQMRLITKQIGLLLRHGDFAGASRLSDTLLAENSAPTADQAAALVWIAAVTGRAELAARLAARAAPQYLPTSSDGQPLSLPVTPREAGLRLMVYAALGVSADSTRAQMERVERALRTWVAPAQQARARTALLGVPAMLAYSDIGLTPLHARQAQGYRLLEWQWATGNGDAAEVRRWISEVDGYAALAEAPGRRSLDGTYEISRILLQVGDTGRAVSQLDALLGALVTINSAAFSPVIQTSVAQAGSLGRILALRAELAARAGDRVIARRWAGAAAALWERADPGLTPVVQRMRTLAGAQ